MDHLDAGRATYEAITLMIIALEDHLSELDRMGARRAGAHLDAAIEQLRRDQAKIDEAEEGQLLTVMTVASG